MPIKTGRADKPIPLPFAPECRRRAVGQLFSTECSLQSPTLFFKTPARCGTRLPGFISQYRGKPQLTPFFLASAQQCHVGLDDLSTALLFGMIGLYKWRWF